MGAAAVATAVARAAEAQPLRLRADAVAETQSPTGIVVLQGQDKANPWMDVEGLVWAGAKPDATGDLMVLAFHAHEPHGYGDLRLGRFVLATGAVRAVAIDGADVIARSPWGTAVETFGGAPVVPRFGARPYDWMAGARLSQAIASRVTAGFSYVQRRQDGDVADEEAGADLSAAPARWLDLGGRAAYDLTSPGLADALASAAVRAGDWRFEAFASERSPSRLVPATSLFSVLGDLPSQSLGGTVRWRAAPRLDLLASGAGQSVSGELGYNGWLRATLRLDDRGDGSMGVELRRVDVSTAQWTGARGVFAQPLGHGLRASSEIEIVVPDHPDGSGVAWPWGLLALAWRPGNGWEVAGAVEASSTPQHRTETDALVRLATTWGSR